MFNVFLIQSSAQDSTDIAKNAVYLEIGGNSGGYALNYERFILGIDKLRLVGKIGGEFIPEHALFFPFGFYGLFGADKHHLELGAGFLWGIFFDPYMNNSTIRATSFGEHIGYRYQKREGGFLFRIAYTPTYLIAQEKYIPWAGLSVGWAF